VHGNPTVQHFTQELTAYLQPPLLKDSFKALYQRIEVLAPKSILDIGCANGDFLHFLPHTIASVGVDASPALVEQARERNKGKAHLSFEAANVLEPEALQKYASSFFDLITVIGTLHAFLDFRPLLDKALSLGPKWILINSPFNDAPVDTHHYHRLSGDPGDYESAYSLHSMATLQRYLTSAGVRAFSFIPCELEVTLEKDPQAPLRNYHIRLQGGERYLTNGIGLLFKEYILEIEC
jgi:SAM-dependent methyltransferase